ncbi:unnamed protein product [Clavelina lepadiformis]|uniref:chitinase n=1 Tax=Clavelina lepadiformis TaxID=159417 RepID=A0ABP0FC83_CLALP
MLKLVIFVVFVAYVAASPAVKSDALSAGTEKRWSKPPTLEDDCEAGATQCAANPSSDPFVKPGDCTHFYQCSNGYLCTMDCPDDLVFNPEIKVCDWPWNVTNCGGGPSPPYYDPDCLSPGGIPISRLPFAKPGDCDSYYKCWRGHRFEFDCPLWFVFNPKTGCCDWPIKVPGCGPTLPPKPVPPPSCTDKNGKPLSTGPMAKPGDCNNFYQCGAGILYTMPCAPGTVFNPDKKSCDWPYNVPGC